MTIKEATIAAIQVPGYSDIAVDKALIDGALNPVATYTVADKSSVNVAALVVLKGMLSVAGLDEGDYGIKYSIEGILARIKDLEDEEGLSAGQPKIRNATFRW